MKNDKIDVFDRKVSCFTSLQDKKPTAELRLDVVLFTDKWKEQISKLRNETNPEKRKSLKGSLPFFVPSGITAGRKDSDMIKHNSIICIDIDKKDNPNIVNFESLKKEIYKVPYIAYAGHSAGGSGYFMIIPIKDPKRHKEHFRSLEMDFKRCGIKIDSACSNECRIRFVSYDPKPYVNKNAKIYNRFIPSAESKSRQLRPTEINTHNLESVKLWMRLLQKHGTSEMFEYSEWFSMACTLSWEFGEDGRELFHTFSEAFPDYDHGNADSKYDEALKAINNVDKKHPTISRIVEIFKRHRIIAIADFEDII